MIAAIAAWLAQRGLSSGTARWVAPALIAVSVVVAAVAGFGIWRTAHDAHVIDQHDAETQLQVEQSGRASDTQMHDRQAAAAAVAAEQRKEFDNAAASLPREGLSRRQRLDLCIELRDAGTDTTVIPQCNDLRSGAQAGAIDRGAAER